LPAALATESAEVFAAVIDKDVDLTLAQPILYFQQAQDYCLASPSLSGLT
jgi:hypothetical protein